MRDRSKLSGMTAMLISLFITGTICMPVNLYSQPSPQKKQWVVVIDAGHGDKDPGSIGISKSKEKNVVLDIALKTGRYITENMKDVKVIYTRDDDTFLGLDERAAVANRNKADIFISIHANAIDDKRPSGVETWVLGQSMDDANLKVAMKENSVITFEENYQAKYEGYDPNSVESFIIFSLMQNTYLKQSTEFASIIQDQFRERVGRKDRGVKQAGFVVLWRTTMPSVLIEVGFITNAEEEKYLLSEQGQDYIASGIFRAFRDYKQTIDKRSGIAQSANTGKEEIAVRDTEKAVAGTAPVPAVAEVKGPDTSATVQTPKQDKQNSGVAATTTPQKQTQASPIKQTTAAEINITDIWYTVQIAALPKNTPARQVSFKGVDNVNKIEAGDRFKYGAGKFSIYEDAVTYRRAISQLYPDAFVIAVRNNRVIPLMEAIKVEKQTTNQ